MTQARHRSDLKRLYRIATKKGGWIDLPHWVEVQQPEANNYDEFDTYLPSLDTWVASIDLEFREVQL